MRSAACPRETRNRPRELHNSSVRKIDVSTRFSLVHNREKNVQLHSFANREPNTEI